MAVQMDDFRSIAERVVENVERVIVGKHYEVQQALIALICRGHLLIEDVPGVGKTTLAKSLARSLGCTFKRMQFTPDLLPSDVTGVSIFNQKSAEFEFRPGPVMAQIVLADEVNRATPKTQSSLLEAMEENQITVDGVTRALPVPFLVLATQNPIEYEGTFPLPEAQLDRFILRLTLGYPTAEEESDILLRFESDTVLPTLEPVTEAAELALMQEAVTKIGVDESVRQYVVAIMQASRKHNGLTLGASPRAGLALYKAAQARAAIQGREFVTPDDVKELAAPVLGHRLILTTNSRLHGRSTGGLVDDMLSSVPVPIER
jgi:MoxR-like ATPase